MRNIGIRERDDFMRGLLREWLAEARHSVTGRPFVSLTYAYGRHPAAEGHGALSDKSK
jgi:hypothetical protein